ncbi:3-hydroxyacyl-CoA dehydrogenase [Thermoactinomyces mirandus]|uniref:3-hydroxyacyl-CoA dehydrogenase n=1 Tax=Thermoactinomyces mirandus TaxID=2756294 RepID=A0A7W1XSV3_9BACL|nr:3-hydroxyacyl-CoA dehydrogenase [Thermoactinomyces mirandus]MBA4602673.1 3-hydroxyacyl-CoA dehydrogenase [Thermoactinomyces mirandus]
MNLKNRVALVTGGASGLGEATVRRIVSEGGMAVIVDLSEEKGEKLRAELGEKTVFLRADVTDETEVKQVVQQIGDRFGQLDILVNCAGIAIAEKVLSRKGSHALSSFAKLIEVNLIGTFNVIRITVEKMAANRPNEEGERGVIVNTASVAAFEGQIGQAAYSASKGGIAAMTLPIARELARYGIRVMAIAPGLFDTPLFASLPEEARDSLGKMVPFPSRLGLPDEFARLVQSIVENPMLNGETIRLDGAIRMQPK